MNFPLILQYEWEVDNETRRPRQYVVDVVSICFSFSSFLYLCDITFYRLEISCAIFLHR